MDDRENSQGLPQAMVDQWKQEVEEEEKSQCVQQVIDNLQNQRVLGELSEQEERKIRGRIGRTRDKMRKRKAEKEEKRKRLEEGVAKFNKGLTTIFAFNILLALVGIIIIYFVMTAG